MAIQSTFVMEVALSYRLVACSLILGCKHAQVIDSSKYIFSKHLVFSLIVFNVSQKTAKSNYTMMAMTLILTEKEKLNIQSLEKTILRLS